MISLEKISEIVNGSYFNIAAMCAIVAWMFIASNSVSQFEKRPGSLHQWRQTDGASMAAMYYQEGNSLWKPQIHNQLGGEGKAGGEFPITYYISGKLYHLFGFHEWILRGIHFLLFIVGLFFLFAQVQLLSSIRSVSLIPFIIFLSSPTLIFYAINFLPDAPALGLAMLALGFMVRFYRLDHHRYLLYAVLFFLVAGLIKISMLTPFIAILAGELAFRVFNRYPKGTLFTAKIGLGGFAISGLALILVFGWYWYIEQYNITNEGLYFLTESKPFWTLSPEEIAGSIEAINDRWSKLFWTVPAMISVALLSIVFFGTWWYKWNIFHVFAAITFFGTICYSLLFFGKFHHHDYYLLALLPNILTMGVAIATSIQPSINASHFPKFQLVTLVLVLLILNTGGASTNTKFKKTYLRWYREGMNNPDLNDLESWLDKNGISYEDKVISLPDVSSNQNLYLMNRKGWTGLTGIYNTDDADALISKGAKYAVVTDTSFYGITFLKYHITDTIGYHGKVGVYRIEKSKWALD